MLPSARQMAIGADHVANLVNAERAHQPRDIGVLAAFEHPLNGVAGVGRGLEALDIRVPEERMQVLWNHRLTS